MEDELGTIERRRLLVEEMRRKKRLVDCIVTPQERKTVYSLHTSRHIFFVFDSQIRS